ncbi:MAG: hypothetical protein AAGI17_10510 [Planctomycetota bacterium]
MALPDGIDEYTLLCERCGYVLEGLDTAGNCPECGKPISESLPERRVGTAWQRNPSFRALLVTLLRSWLRPRSTLDTMRTSSRPGLWIGFRGIGLASLIFSLSVAAWFSTGISFEDHIGSTNQIIVRIVSAVVGFAVPFAIITVILLLLTATEAAGLRFIARRRGFRVDKKLSREICGHGTIGWVVAAIAPAGEFIYIATRFAINDPPEFLSWVEIAIVFIGVISGFMIFELFAYLGLRRCKFANRIKPSEDQDNEPLAQAREHDNHDPSLARGARDDTA